MNTSTHIPALTGVRGVAAVWVVMFHLGLQLNGTPGFSDTMPFVQTGFLGVDLFFILSGAVMYHVHAKDFTAYSAAAHMHFLKLRLARIFPLHLFCLMAFVAALWILPGFAAQFDPGTLDLSKFFISLFMVNNWGFSSRGAWNPPTWSLSAEWLGYLFFPFIIVGIRKTVPKGYEVVVAFLVLALMLTTVFLLRLPEMNVQGRIGILRMACEFSTGCLLYRFATRDGAVFRAWIFLLAMFICLVSAYGLQLHWGAVFGLALLVMSLCRRNVWTEMTFANPVLIWLGEISFSLYLSHWPLMQIIRWLRSYMGFDAEAEAIILVASIPLVAASLYYFVELPSRRYIRRKIAVPKLDSGKQVVSKMPA